VDKGSVTVQYESSYDELVAGQCRWELHAHPVFSQSAAAAAAAAAVSNAR